MLSGATLARFMLKPPIFPNLPVLVIDDSAFARRILRSMLEPVGIRQIIEAGDAEEALNRLAKIKPSLILLDWNLPTMSARDLLAILRNPAKSTDVTVPVIIVTAAPTMRVIEEADKQHVVHVLRKPFAPKALWKRMGCFFNELDPVLDIFGGGGAQLISSRAPASGNRLTSTLDRFEH
jgi:two-component system chemotaxis response regulator CheY